jgi:PIN domain nuclease of toxin-antitoxin system
MFGEVMSNISSLLLDTHILIWLAEGTTLSAAARQTINKAATEDKVFISAISIWEICVLTSKNRITLSQPVKSWFADVLSTKGFQLIPLTPEISYESCFMPAGLHADPCDRIIVATARLQNFTLLTKDAKILAYANDGFVNAITD